MPRMRARGFTLVELMVTIAIVAILLTLGMPSFRDTLQRNRVATTTNEIIGSLSLARNEAIRTTRGGGICASADGSTCGTDWNAGWLIWANQGTPDDTFNTGDEIIRVIPAHPQMALTVTNEAGTALGKIAFDARGRSLSPTPVSMNLKPTSCAAGRKLVRTLSVNLVGQVRTSEGTCS